MNKRAAKPSSHPQESARKAHGAATMRHTRTSTLEGSELRWRSAVYAVCAVSLALGVTILACAFPDGASRPSTYLWVACALAFATLTASNAAYLARHPGRPTIGMMPVAVASAGAAAAPLAASATGSAAPLRTCAIVALALGVACVAVFGCLFVKMRAAYANAPAPGEKSVLIVLGAAVRSGRPCQTLARRLDVAADLLLGHPHRMAVLTGGASAARPIEPTEAEAMARYLRECGVPEAQLLLDEVNITANRNTIPFEPLSPFVTSGLRLGTPALTTRGFKEADLQEVGKIIALVLSDVENEEKKAEARKRVAALCKKYPLYAGM